MLYLVLKLGDGFYLQVNISNWGARLCKKEKKGNFCGKTSFIKNDAREKNNTGNSGGGGEAWLESTQEKSTISLADLWLPVF